MRCLIASAGYGSRMGDIVKDKPKPLLEINGKSILQRIIERLHIYGIKDIIINVHYLPMIISEKIESNALYFYEPRLLGHEATLKALESWLKDEDFYFLNGDTLSNIDFNEMKKVHKPQTITALMDENRAAGAWIYPKEYFNNIDLPIYPYRPKNLAWFDCGTPDRLAKAKEYYENGGQN